MSDEWSKLVERAEYYLAEEFIPRRDVRNVFRGLLTEATVSRDSVVNWRTLIWNIHDEEMGVDPKRIATCMNFINEHYEDCETSEDFEKQLNELLETEEEVLDKLEAIKPILKQIEENTNSRPPRVSLEELHLNEQWFRVWKILEGETLQNIGDKAQ